MARLGSTSVELEGHRTLLAHRTTGEQLSTRSHYDNCPNLDPDSLSSTDSSPGAPGSVGGNIPLRGYWTGPSPQGPGEERQLLSAGKIQTP